jgi:hypothetical protein
VLRAFHVDEFADSGQRYGGYAYNDALQTAKSERVPNREERARTAGLSARRYSMALPLITNSPRHAVPTITPLMLMMVGETIVQRHEKVWMPCRWGKFTVAGGPNDERNHC